MLAACSALTEGRCGAGNCLGDTTHPLYDPPGILALTQALKLPGGTLRTLNLSFNHIGAWNNIWNAANVGDMEGGYVEDAAALGRALRANNTITSVSLRYNSLGNSRAAALLDAGALHGSQPPWPDARQPSSAPSDNPGHSKMPACTYCTFSCQTDLQIQQASLIGHSGLG